MKIKGIKLCLSRVVLPLTILLTTFGGLAWAQKDSAPAQTQPESGSTDSTESKIDQLRQHLRLRLGTLVIENLKPSPLPNYYEFISSGRIFYISEDGRYLLQGNAHDLLTSQNLTERSLEAFMKPNRLEKLEAFTDDIVIAFSPETTRYSVTIATDTTCGYCRKLHREIAEYLAAGIEIRYAFFPRNGIAAGNGGYDSMVSIWCADDRAQALTDVKSGGSVAPATCDNPVSEHYENFLSMGIKGTPTIFTEKGAMFGGYLPAAELLKHLRREEDEQNSTEH